MERIKSEASDLTSLALLQSHEAEIANSLQNEKSVLDDLANRLSRIDTERNTPISPTAKPQ